MSIHTLFVVNPISGDNDKSSVIKTIRNWAQSSGESIEIWETTGKDDKEKLEQKFKAAPPKKMVAVGGDGTVLLCASVIMNTTTSLGILPLGSANGMSVELHIPQHIDNALDVIHRGHTRKSDMLLFNDTQLGIHISDIGLNAGLVKQFEEGPRRGFLGYAKGLVIELSDLKTFHIEVETDKESFKTEGYMVAFGNAKRYGTGALLNKVGKINDGLFELSILKSFDITAIAGHFFEIINDESEHMKTIQCSRVRIKVDEKVPFQIDGEGQGEINEITVEIIPSCLHFIVPQSKIL